MTKTNEIARMIEAATEGRSNLKETATLAMGNAKAQAAAKQRVEGYTGKKKAWARLSAAIAEGNKAVIAEYAEKGLAAGLANLPTKSDAAKAKPAAKTTKSSGGSAMTEAMKGLSREKQEALAAFITAFGS